MIEQRTQTKNWSSMLRVSKSQIQTYLICPRKFWFQYVIGAAWEFMPSSLPFGRALHATVASFYQSLKLNGIRPELPTFLSEFEFEWGKETAGAPLLLKGDTSQESLLDTGKALLQTF